MLSFNFMVLRIWGGITSGGGKCFGRLGTKALVHEDNNNVL